MPYFLVERTFASEEEPRMRAPGDSLEARRRFLENNKLARVVWLRSFVTLERNRSFCLYESLSPEAVRQAAELNGLPVDRISEVCVQTAGAVGRAAGCPLAEAENRDNGYERNP
jgi:hypothetical protein